MLKAASQASPPALSGQHASAGLNQGRLDHVPFVLRIVITAVFVRLYLALRVRNRFPFFEVLV
jgi:hypothetical protein